MSDLEEAEKEVMRRIDNMTEQKLEELKVGLERSERVKEEALINEGGARRREWKLQAEVERLQERLEITHFYNLKGEKELIPPEDRADTPDGIVCRDCTIELMQDTIDKQKLEVERLREALLEGQLIIENHHAKALNPEYTIEELGDVFEQALKEME